MFPRAYLDTVIRWDPSSHQLEQCKLTKDHHGCWQLQTISSLSLFGSPYPHVLTLDTIYNAASGQYEPFALRTASSKTTDGDVVLSRWSISTRSCHDVPEAVDTRIARSSIACSIASGPTVIYFTTSDLYVVLPKPRTVESLILSNKQLRLISQAVPSNTSSTGCDGERFAMEHVWSFDWAGKEIGSLASVLVVVKCLNCSTSITPAASFLASVLISLSGKGLHHSSPQEAMIPQEYASIICCLALHWILSINPDNAAATMTPIHSGTSYNQLVVVEVGSILHCIDVGATPTQVIAVQVRHVAERGEKEVMSLILTPAFL